MFQALACLIFPSLHILQVVNNLKASKTLTNVCKGIKTITLPKY